MTLFQMGGDLLLITKGRGLIYLFILVNKKENTVTKETRVFL